MGKDEVTRYIAGLIEKGELWRFYKSKDWIELKTKILDEDHHECYVCKQNGIITRYDTDKDGNKVLLSTVHHVQFVRKHPALALSRTYEHDGKTYRNLIPVCKACHNKLHPEKNKRTHIYTSEKFTNEEKW